MTRKQKECDVKYKEKIEKMIDDYLVSRIKCCVGYKGYVKNSSKTEREVIEEIRKDLRFQMEMLEKENANNED